MQEAQPATVTPPRFQQLIDDIILGILSACGIPAVHAISRTCKQLRTLALSKHVWLALVTDLQAGFFIDLAPGQKLIDLSVEELISLAKRAVLGPQSWSSSSPTLLRRQIVNVGPRTAFTETPDDSVQLLDGGRYVLSRRGQSLKCYDVHVNTVVWEYKGKWDYEKTIIIDYEAQIGGGGHSMVIVLTLCILSESNEIVVELNHADLKTNHSCCRFSAMVSSGVPLPHAFEVLGSPIMRGKIAVIPCFMQPQGLIVVDHTTQRSVIVQVAAPFSVEVTCGHIILMTSVIELGLSTARVTVLDAQGILKGLEPYSSVVIAVDTIVPAAKWASPVCPPHPCLQLAAYASPLHDEYIVWACALRHDWPGIHAFGDFSIGYRTHLSFHTDKADGHESFSEYSTDSRVKLRQSYVSRRLQSGISYTGHYTTLIDEQRYLAEWNSWLPRDEVGQEIPGMTGANGYVHMSSYSGALTYFEGDQINIDYYL